MLNWLRRLLGIVSPSQEFAAGRILPPPASWLPKDMCLSDAPLTVKARLRRRRKQAAKAAGRGG